HPHGDASIGDAIIQIGQKDLLIDTQGNWGNVLTGDSAAAPRYIEARLTPFALEVIFSPKVTTWLASYDGRNKEPITFPTKFPLLLAQGAEGIAVGLSTKILPHNFIEIIDSMIDALRNNPIDLLPDFPQGGTADCTSYNGGSRGGRIRVRAKIEMVKKHLLKVVEIPFGTTTTSLIDSVLAANDKGKIKISKIEDNTAEFVEIMIHLPSTVSADEALPALYAFTDCEVSLAPNACVIKDNHPQFLSVNDLIKSSADQTRELLRQELEIRLGELREKWHFASLEKIFIEKRIYRDIEKEETWEGVISAVDKGLKPYIKIFQRAITQDDILRLLEIRIKRISKYDSFRADEV
ncbi:MAG: DNA topoisomerase, partial [Opitutae bacterium]|nr:DNA topoisomerase [Opitutae bacterium]